METPAPLVGLQDAELLALLEGVAGVPLIGFTVEASCPPQAVGSGADKCLCAFGYTTGEGARGSATLFVKRCTWENRSEAVHYSHLAARGVPVPRFYGALLDSGGVEVVFLETVTGTGFDRNSDSEWRALLSLLARFAACAVTPDYAAHLRPFDLVGWLREDVWACGWDAACPPEEDIRDALRICDMPEADAPALVHAARTLFDQIAAQPQALLHQDLSPDNFGWRGEREEMVVFDLQKNALGPRFADAAPYLALPHWPENSVRREAFARHYLHEYARFGGPAVSLATFDAETTALFWALRFSALAGLDEPKGTQLRREIGWALRQKFGDA